MRGRTLPRQDDYLSDSIPGRDLQTNDGDRGARNTSCLGGQARARPVHRQGWQPLHIPLPRSPGKPQTLFDPPRSSDAFRFFDRARHSALRRQPIASTDHRNGSNQLRTLRTHRNRKRTPCCQGYVATAHCLPDGQPEGQNESGQNGGSGRRPVPQKQCFAASGLILRCRGNYSSKSGSALE